jgi:hypothetical protein
MAGFGRIAFEGEYFNQKIVNVLHYRSSDWAPLGGNPFDDVLAFVDGVIANVQTQLLACMSDNYTLVNVTGVGYDNDYSIVTASPLVRNVNLPGTRGSGDTNGAAGCAILGLRCGEQVQINSIGKSKRNRGYLAVGPLQDVDTDDYSHLPAGITGVLNTLGQHVMLPITLLLPTVTLQPVRIHEKWATVLGVKVLQWRTYSDILGYTVRRVASYRRSRQPEA